MFSNRTDTATQVKEMSKAEAAEHRASRKARLKVWEENVAGAVAKRDAAQAKLKELVDARDNETGALNSEIQRLRQEGDAILERIAAEYRSAPLHIHAHVDDRAGAAATS